MDNELTSFPINLYQLRKRRNLSQQQLAELAEIPRTTISNFESGSGNPTLQNLMLIATSLQVSINELLTVPVNEVQLISSHQMPLKKERREFSVQDLIPNTNDIIEIEKLEIRPNGLMGGVPHLKGSKEYFICFKGTATVIVEGVRYILKTGDLLIFPGDSRHSYKNDKSTTLTGISIILHQKSKL
jgi:transcriptional regulator with XRE-family HTH domain